MNCGKQYQNHYKQLCRMLGKCLVQNLNQKWNCLRRKQIQQQFHKLCGSQGFGKYYLIFYTIVTQTQMAKAGTAIFVSKKFSKQIYCFTCINEINADVLQSNTKIPNYSGTNAPEKARKILRYFNTLQQRLFKISKLDYIMLVGNCKDEVNEHIMSQF